MTDRELLEAAAKAAGHRIKWGEKYFVGPDEVDCTDLAYVLSDSPDESPSYWNPLEDDGDALRLAVKLRLDVDFDTDNPIVEVYRKLRDDSAQVFCEALTADPNAAVRRAIVTAAAEIGKGMP